MVNMRRHHDATFKARVALEAVKREKTLAQISSVYKVHPNQIRQWRNHLLEILPDVFSNRRKTREKEREEVEQENPVISISRQCDLVELARSSFYYRSLGEDEYNLHLMRLLDEQFTRTPFYGARKMHAWLRTQGHEVNRKRISRFRRLMGLEAIYPKPRLSRPGPDHKIYPYLLKGITVSKPDHVWCADIASIRLAHGFVYLVVILDWASRYILSWELSITLEKAFCLEALRRALLGSKPEIFTTDQGSQFTSLEFVGH